MFGLKTSNRVELDEIAHFVGRKRGYYQSNFIFQIYHFSSEL